ncbi:putative reverse transcriptase domain-containing protein [Tanacetum coccineum]
MEHELWNLKVKEYNIVAYTQRFNELALMCLRMVEPKIVKVDAYIRGLTDNIKGEGTSSKPANLNEAVRMAHKLMEQKSQARDKRILEGNKRKWERFQSGNSSAMVTAPTDERVSSGSVPLCERCFTRHVGLCTIKCHKCGKIGHKARYCKEENVATSANALPILTCYDCGEQGHTRNQCPRKVKQEEVGEVRGRDYDIKDAEPKGPNVVTVNHIFEIDLMPIELGTFDVIIGMDWLVKHDAVIINLGMDLKDELLILVDMTIGAPQVDHRIHVVHGSSLPLIKGIVDNNPQLATFSKLLIINQKLKME